MVKRRSAVSKFTLNPTLFSLLQVERNGVCPTRLKQFRLFNFETMDSSLLYPTFMLNVFPRALKFGEDEFAYVNQLFFSEWDELAEQSDLFFDHVDS